MRYVAIIEKAPDGSYSAYLSDLPGCASTGDAPAEVRANVKEAVALYLEYLREHGRPTPEPMTVADIVNAL